MIERRERLELKEAYKRVGITKNALYTMARNGSVPVLKIGNRYIFDMQLLEDHLTNLAIQTAEKIRLSNKSEPVKYGVIRRIAE